jgi:hypothetical protein
VYTSFLLALPLWALLAGPSPTPPPPTLTLKDGRVMELKELPRSENGRVVFTTLEGKTYSLDASEVLSFVGAPPTPTRTPNKYNPMDSRNLGAIARQERAKTGKTSDLSAQQATPRPPRKTPTRKPTRIPTPKPTAKPASP